MSVGKVQALPSPHLLTPFTSFSQRCYFRFLASVILGCFTAFIPHFYHWVRNREVAVISPHVLPKTPAGKVDAAAKPLFNLPVGAQTIGSALNVKHQPVQKEQAWTSLSQAIAAFEKVLNSEEKDLLKKVSEMALKLPLSKEHLLYRSCKDNSKYKKLMKLIEKMYKKCACCFFKMKGFKFGYNNLYVFMKLYYLQCIYYELSFTNSVNRSPLFSIRLCFFDPQPQFSLFFSNDEKINQEIASIAEFFRTEKKINHKPLLFQGERIEKGCRWVVPQHREEDHLFHKLRVNNESFLKFLQEHSHIKSQLESALLLDVILHHPIADFDEQHIDSWFKYEVENNNTFIFSFAPDRVQ